MNAPHAAWEFANGPLPGAVQVLPCRADKSCVRLEHLSPSDPSAMRKRARSAPGTGTKRRIRPGVWKLTMTIGKDAKGNIRRQLVQPDR